MVQALEWEGTNDENIVGRYERAPNGECDARTKRRMVQVYPADTRTKLLTRTKLEKKTDAPELQIRPREI
jgi:hypothetical protein